MVPDMTIPDVHSYDHLVDRAKSAVGANGPRRAVLIAPKFADDIEALARARDEQLIKATVIGEVDAVMKMAAEVKVSLDGIDLQSAADRGEAVDKAVRLVDDGAADMLINGGATAAEILGLLFQSDVFVEGRRFVSHIAVIKPERYRKLIMLTDSAVNARVNLKVKMSLIENVISFAGKIGMAQPRIALLAAVEAVYPQMEVTTEAAIIAKMAERHQIKGGFVDGPLSFDVAVDMEAAHAKGVTTSEVAGQADAMVAPHIEVANGIYKAMSLYGPAEIGGVVVGGKVPLSLPSRSDRADGRFRSIVLACLAV